MSKGTEKGERKLSNSASQKVLLVALGERIQELRKEKGLTQIELSYRCEMERSNMRRIEAGGTNPTIATLKKISSALGISLSELFENL